MRSDWSITSNSESLAARLETIEKRVGAWTYYELIKQAKAYRDEVKQNWLSGQALDVRTGFTRDSVWAWKNRRGEILVRVGAFDKEGHTIQGSLNYLARFTGTPHEFMRPAWTRFSAGNRVEKAVQSNFDRMMKKVIEDEK